MRRIATGLVLALACAGVARAQDSVVPPPGGIQWVPSPNYSNRSPGAVIDAIVVHTTEGSTASGAISWFQNPNSQVSAHFVISPQGAITQMVAIEKKAWHATYYNDRSIGIECVRFANSPSTWTPALMDALTSLCAWLCDAYDIPVIHPGGNAYDYPNNTFNAPGLVGHNQVQPWNKSDPGPYFNWAAFVSEVQSKIDAAYAQAATDVDVPFVVTASALNVRAGPGTNYPVVGVMP
jgi:N-acetyl-anhydromuramyl-L-alanine amidase AmpD